VRLTVAPVSSPVWRIGMTAPAISRLLGPFLFSNENPAWGRAIRKHSERQAQIGRPRALKETAPAGKTGAVRGVPRGNWGSQRHIPRIREQVVMFPLKSGALVTSFLPFKTTTGAGFFVLLR
jgi:hypothetical protein